MKYKLRSFYSKGAFLVLVWTLLITSVMTILYRITKSGYLHYTDQRLFLLPIIAFTPIAGWLADVRYGNFKVFKFGALLFFFSAVMTCISMIIKGEGVHPTVTLVATTAAVFVAYLGVSACAVTALQLGLDQMPDASSDNVLSSGSFSQLFLVYGLAKKVQNLVLS